MQTSLEAYGAALDYLIEAMKHIRESFREMIREQIGMEQYEEYLKDNRAAEKAKEMRPDAAERNEISEQEKETQEEDRKQREEKALQERPEKPNDHQGNQMEQQDQAFGQHVMSRTETGSEGERDAGTPYDTHQSGVTAEHDAGQQRQIAPGAAGQHQNEARDDQMLDCLVAHGLSSFVLVTGTV